ncbi:MAG: hypothetical protein ACK5P7_11085 [Bdellovibrio sp.]|jgi:hypothetical protein
MDIKNVLKGIIPIEPKVIDRLDRTIKSDAASDRDGNGQTPYGEQNQQDHGPMSDEQLQKCLEHLQNLPSVKEHSWTAELVKIEGRNFVLLKDAEGKTIRRIQESELWSLQSAGKTDKGQVLRKTA